MNDSLFDAYRRTAFIADTPLGPLRIRVGGRCAELDALLRASGSVTWAYVTAFNPGSVALSDDDNAARQRELEAVVAKLGYVSFPGMGIGDDGRWPPEPSLLIFGITRDGAKCLGRQFGQLAVVYGEANQEAEMLLCD